MLQITQHTSQKLAQLSCFILLRKQTALHGQLCPHPGVLGPGFSRIEPLVQHTTHHSHAGSNLNVDIFLFVCLFSSSEGQQNRAGASVVARAEHQCQ